MELANELRMSKVMQLCAAIAPRGFVLPKHLNLMSSDAGNRARSAGLIIVFTDGALSDFLPINHGAPPKCHEEDFGAAVLFHETNFSPMCRWIRRSFVVANAFGFLCIIAANAGSSASLVRIGTEINCRPSAGTAMINSSRKARFESLSGFHRKATRAS